MHLIRRSSFYFWTILFFLCPQTATGAEQQEWKLTADTVSADQGLDILEAKGNVVLFQGEDYLEAEYARYYVDTRWVYLEGNVRARWEGDILEAEKAEFDLQNKVGWLTQGQVFMAEPHIYFKGRDIRKTGQSTYSFTKATVTSCDGAPPAWSLQCSSGTLTIDGYARIWEPTFRIKNLPVLYSPFLVIPVKTKRQSGFLLPELSQSSRLGLQIDQAYYHVLDEERDLTAYANIMTKRGIMPGVEFRHTSDLYTKGLWRADYLYDRLAANSRGELDSQFQDESPLLLRPNHNRYWLRSKYDGYLFDPNWKTKLDLDFVSDSQYLREFKNGFSGFQESRNDFLEQFGRDIEDNDSLERISTFLISKNWAGIGLSGLAEYTQNLKYFNHASDLYPSSLNPTVQRLPEINLNTYKTSLLKTPLEWQSRNQLAYFWRDFGTTGTRLETSPSVSLPLTSEYGGLIGTLGWRGTAYAVDRHEGDHENLSLDANRSFYFRSLPFFQAVASTDLFRIYDLNSSPTEQGRDRWTRIKHQILPKLTYDLIPNEYETQKDNPYFDESDRIRGTNNLTYSLTSTFTRKAETLVADAEAEGNGFALESNYHDFLRLKLEQSFDFREAQRTEELDEYERRPFSDVMAQISCAPKDYLLLSSKTYYSPYLNRLTSHEHRLTAFLPRSLGSVFCGLDFTDLAGDEYPYKTNSRYLLDEDDSLIALRQRVLELGADLRINPSWRVGTMYRADMEAGLDLEKTLKVTYDHQCYSLQFTAQETDYDTRFSVQVNLLNLGSVGN